MTLVWRDHREYLKETLTRLKRFDQSTDVTLICADEEELKAHKIVLSASSQLFYSVLDNVPFNCVIHLPEVNYKDLSMILEYEPKDEELKEMVSVIDQDGDGDISFNEFVWLMTRSDFT